MSIRKIHEVGDPCLAKVCRPVTEFNDRLHELLDDMADTLEEAGGVGLAAPQVGILRRVCIVEDEQGEIIELINPEIIKAEGEQTGLEGCLSVPGKYGIVTRPMVVRVRAQDRYGTEFEVEDEELTARCFCHEIEHLDGHLYTEHCKVLTDEELEQWSKGVAKRDRKRRNVGLKIFVVIILLVVAAFGGALFMYTQGWGYPSQDSVATQLFADPDNASALYSAEVSDTSAASMTNSLVKDSAPTINAVEKSMTDSTVYVTAETDGGGQMQYKLSMVRDLIGWKVSNVELYFPSQN